MFALDGSLAQRLPTFIMDGKGDMGEGSLLDIVQRLNQGRRKIYVISLSDPTNSDKYNPFLGASSAMATDMLINMTDWSEDHYKLNAERYIQRITQLMELAKVPFSFGRIITCMKPNKFTDMSNYLLKEGLISKEEHVDNLELLKGSGKVAQSSVAKFSTIAESQAGKILADDGINIAQALKENAIILFILNPMVYPVLSPALGRLVLIDSKIAIGELFQSKIPRTFFILDEISSYGDTMARLYMTVGNGLFTVCVLIAQALIFIAEWIEIYNNRKKESFSPMWFVITLIKLLFTAILFVVQFLMKIVISISYRRSEYRADRYAYDLGHGAKLVKAFYLMEKIQLGDNRSVLQKMTADHPRITARIERLESMLDQENVMQGNPWALN